MRWPGSQLGALVGLAGVGGGSLMTPLLMLLFGVAAAAVVGTGLWFAALTKLAGGTLQHARGNVDLQVLARPFAGSLPASIATPVWLQPGGASAIRVCLIAQLLGAVLLLTAAAMLLRLCRPARDPRLGLPQRRRPAGRECLRVGRPRRRAGAVRKARGSPAGPK